MTRVGLVAVALLLCSCSPANGLGEQAVDDPYALPGTCPKVGASVIDYASFPGYASTQEALQTYLDDRVQNGDLSTEQAQLLVRVLTEDPSYTKAGEMIDLITAQRATYTVTASVEKLPDGSRRVGSFGLECTGQMPGG